MTRNNAASKKEIRARMAQTGENYCVAMRKLEEIRNTPVTVQELGEDGDSWLIEGTADMAEAKKALDLWFNDVYPPDDTFLMHDRQYVLEEAEGVYRDDWFWRPLHAEYPHDEAVLRNKTQYLSEYSGQELFSGIHITA